MHKHAISLEKTASYGHFRAVSTAQMAALKMSTCFEGSFTLPDLAASSCSQWGGATHFDLPRGRVGAETLRFRGVFHVFFEVFSRFLEVFGGVWRRLAQVAAVPSHPEAGEQRFHRQGHRFFFF